MPRAEWTPIASSDLAEIAYYIAVKDCRPVTADRIIDEIHEKAQQYATMPETGTARPDLDETIRCFRHKRWIIFYEPVDTGILVHRVIDGSRDYPHLFGKSAD